MQKKFGLLTRAIIVSCSLVGTMPTQAQTLADAIQHAINTNPDVLYASANRFGASERLKQARAGFLPVVELRAGVGRERSRNQTAAAIGGSSGEVTYTRREAEAVLTQNLFAGGQNFSEVERTRSHLIGESYEIMAKSNDVALAVAEKYLDIMRHQELLRLARSNLSKHQHYYGMIKERSESGVGREADLIQADARVSLARSNVISEEAELRDAETAFNRVVGSEGRRLNWPRDSHRDIPRTLDEALRIAHKNHPAVKAITADVAAHEAQHRSAKANLFPRVDLVVGASRNNNLDGIRGPNHDEYVMVRGSYTLFRGGATMAKIRETAYETQMSNEVRNRTLAQLDEHVRLSYNGMRSVSQRMHYLARHRSASASALSAYNEQFTVGRRTLLDLLDSQNEYYASSVEYANSRYDLLMQRYRVLNSMGRLLAHFRTRLPAEATVPDEPHHVVL